MIIKFKDRFNRNFGIYHDYTINIISYIQYFDVTNIKCRYKIPASFCLNGDILWDGSTELHNSTGPASTYITGDLEYWLNGDQVTALEVSML